MMISRLDDDYHYAYYYQHRIRITDVYDPSKLAVAVILNVCEIAPPPTHTMRGSEAPIRGDE